ncbi:hypothetical protein F5Y10DRAFT_112124 [Nemania abortiva]|nr:hypothetical protein F5Y10DRAFT_112124 [Nemania abortiva]
MPLGPPIKNDPLSLGPLSVTPNVDESRGNSSDPIVISDDDSRSRTAPVRKKRKRKSNSSSLLLVPTKGGNLVPHASDVCGPLTQPQILSSILQPVDEAKADAENKISRLLARVSSLEATVLSIGKDNQALKAKSKASDTEIDGLEEKLRDADSVLAKAQQRVDDLSLRDAVHVEKIRQLESQLVDKKSLETELECVQLQNSKLAETVDNLKRELEAEKQAVQQKEAELAEKTKEVKNAENQANLATSRLRKTRGDLLNATTSLAATQDDYNILIGKLDKSQKECGLLPSLRFSLMTTEIDLSAATTAYNAATEKMVGLESQLKKVEKENAILRKQTAELKSDKATLKEENEMVISSSKEANARAEENRRYLQQSLDGLRKNQEAIKVDRDKLQKEIKDATDERAGLCRRIHDFEGELTAAKQRVSVLENVESELQVAQEQVAAMSKHMEQCPIASKSQEFWDDWLEEVNKISEALRKLGSTPNESSREASSSN